MAKILVIEDEDQIRENLCDILELSNYEVVSACNGRIGVQQAQSHHPDLIICDIMMPELNGYDALAVLRENPTTALIPIIFLTAKVDRMDQRYGMELGADDYLTKPFESEELIRAIESRLERQRKFKEKLSQERQQSKELQQKLVINQQKVEESQQVVQIKSDLLQRISQELRNPLSNINVAIQLLRKAQTDEERDRYLKILQEECAREIKILNEIEQLQNLLTPENTEILHRFRLLKP